MKRKKSANKAQKVAKQVQISSENTEATALETPEKCSLCLSDESPASECQQFLFDNLENAFGFSVLKIPDKNKFKICVTCSYHISVLAKFVNNNICMSGANPLCFMCKNYTIFDIRPNDLKAQLKNSPFGTQTEDKGNYYACVVCLYQLRKYQNYKNLIDNYLNEPVTPTTSTTARIKSTVALKSTVAPKSNVALKSTVAHVKSISDQSVSGSSEPSVVSSTKTVNSPTVLLHKLDVSKFKLTSFDLAEDNAITTKPGRKRGRADSIHTEVLPKKRRYDPSPEPSDDSDVDDAESLIFETWGSGKKSGKRVTINTRPSVMKTPSGASKTPMKSALKTPQKTPQKTPVKAPQKSQQKPPSNKGKPAGKLQIKFPPRVAKTLKETSEVVKGTGRGRPSKSPTVVTPVEPAKPIGRPRKSTNASPRLPVKLETKNSKKVEADEKNTDDDLGESIPETPKTGRKKRMSPKKPAPMKTPAEKKQMVAEVPLDEGVEGKDDSDAEDTLLTENDLVDIPESSDVTPGKIIDLIVDQEDDDQAEVIIPEDTDNMAKMIIDEDSEVNHEDSDNENAGEGKESREMSGKIIDPNTSVNLLDDDDDDEQPAPTIIGDTVSEIVEFIKTTIAQEVESQNDTVAGSTSTSTKAAATGTTANGNSNSDKENTVDLLRDESNSSDFGVIKKLNNNERVQLDINMDKIFDELRTEATP